MLYGLGQDWLVDGGLYIHDHGEPVREYLRGCRSHSTTFPASSTALRPRTPQNWGIDGFAHGPAGTVLAATTGMFEGVTFRRQLQSDHAGRIVVFDRLRFQSRPPERRLTAWQIAGNKMVEIDQDSVVALSPDGKSSLRLTFSQRPEEITVLTGSRDPIGGLHSESYGQLISCHSVVVDWGIGRELAVETVLELTVG